MASSATIVDERFDEEPDPSLIDEDAEEVLASSRRGGGRRGGRATSSSSRRSRRSNQAKPAAVAVAASVARDAPPTSQVDFILGEVRSTVCPTATRPSSQAACLAAGQRLLPPGFAVSRLITGTWSHLPPGCSQWQNGVSSYIHFNFNNGGRGEQYSRRVCEGNFLRAARGSRVCPRGNSPAQDACLLAVQALLPFGTR